MPFRVISEADRLAGKLVLVRLDTNVPLKGNKIEDDTRLREALPTIRFLERRGAKIILVGHLGRPEGKKVASLSLKPIGYALGKLLKQPVKVLPLSMGAEALHREAKRGLVLLENIRFEKGEDKNDAALARSLARLADVYVNEAFSVSHRAAASLVGITKYLPSYAGLHLAHEVAALQQVRKSGHKPVVVIIGGAKVADKLPVISKLLPRVAAVLVGGGVANTFLAAKGVRVGKSLVDKAALKPAKLLLRRAGKKLFLPQDVITDRVGTKRHEVMWRDVAKVSASERIVDLGTRTTQAYAVQLKRARTILWAGPLGLAEVREWAHASLALGRLVTARSGGRAYSLVGGGDTVHFFHQHDLTADHLSTAGGALLDLLAGAKLPGLTALGWRG